MKNYGLIVTLFFLSKVLDFILLARDLILDRRWGFLLNSLEIDQEPGSVCIRKRASCLAGENRAFPFERYHSWIWIRKNLIPAFKVHDESLVNTRI